MTEEELANFTAMMADRNYQTFLRFGEMIQKSLIPVLEIYKKIIVESIPVIMQRIIDKHKEIMRMWSDYLEEYLSRSFEIIPIQHFDLLFCDSPSIQETHIACNHSNAPPVVVRKTLKDRLHNVKAKALNIWTSKPIKWIRQFTYDCSTQIISSALFSLLIYLLRVWGVL